MMLKRAIPRHPLLESVAALTAGAVYQLGDKQTVTEAFQDCQHLPVCGMNWDKSGESLQVEVRDGRRSRVEFSLREGGLHIACSCLTFRKRGNCRHRLAALITLKKIVDPAAFSTITFPDDYRRLLEKRLRDRHTSILEDDIEPAQYISLVIEKKPGNAHVYVRHNGDIVTSFHRELPAEINRFVSGHSTLAAPADFLRDFIERFGDRYPVLYKSGSAEHVVSPDFGQPLELVTEISADTAADTIQVQRRLHTDSSTQASLLLEGRIVLDLQRQTVSILRDYSGWEPHQLIKTALFSAPGFLAGVQPQPADLTIPMETFRQLTITVAEKDRDTFLRACRFRVDRRPCEAAVVSAAEAELHLQARPGAEAGTMELEAGVTVSGVEVTPNPVPFSVLHADFLHQLPPTQRGKKRRAVMIEHFFSSVTADSGTALQELRRRPLGEEAFEPMHAEQLRRLLIPFMEVLYRHEYRLHYHDGRWLLIGMQACRQLDLLAVPFRFFGAEIFDGSGGPMRMTIENETFQRLLPEFLAVLQQKGIRFFLEDRPVRTGNWEFRFEADAGARIDWLELKPEIRCDGVRMSVAELRRSLRKYGYIVMADGICLPDAASRRILDTLNEGDEAPRAGADGEVVPLPRLRILDFLRLRKLGMIVTLPPAEEEIFHRLLHFQGIGRRPLPALQTTLRPYQEEGYNWLAFLYENRFGACLADDMGLGKTLQAIALLAARHEGLVGGPADVRRPHLVILPPSLLFNWESELQRFYPGIPFTVYSGRERESEFAPGEAVLLSYETCRRDIALLQAIEFDLIILDEAQAVKNIHAGVTAAVRQLRGRFKIALTGTPVENHLGEYFSIMDLVLPGLLGDYAEYAQQMRQPDDIFLEKIVQRTKPFVLRRTKEAICHELPPKTESEIFLELSDEQKEQYNRVVNEARTTIRRAFSGPNTGQARVIALTAILKLRQICLSPALADPGQPLASPKLEFLQKKLEELYNEGHSVLIFSQFTSFLDLVEAEIRQIGLPLFRLDGSTPTYQRKKIVTEFQQSAAPAAFLLSLKAGGKGLNLTRASYVFHLDPWWNPAVENQATDRAHRLGQQEHVTVTKLLMRHTVEEKMMVLKNRKLQLYDALLNSGRDAGGGAISREDFEYLLDMG